MNFKVLEVTETDDSLFEQPIVNASGATIGVKAYRPDLRGARCVQYTTGTNDEGNLASFPTLNGLYSFLVTHKKNYEKVPASLKWA